MNYDDKAPCDFDTRSRRLVSHFIQSVVIMDDLAEFGSSNEVESQSGLIDPEFEVIQENRTESEEQSSDRSANSSSATGVPLNAKLVTDRFAELGSVCAVLKPDDEEEFHEKVAKVAARADIVVLDWKIGDSYGEDTLEIVRKILEDDRSSQRMRLLAIYTGEPALDEIANAVRSTVSDFYDEHELIEIDGFRMSKGPIRAIILAKEDTLNSAMAELSAQEIKEDALADKLIEEFAEMTQGLLRNVALEGLAALRDNVHRLLAKFDTMLDPAYLGHRLLIRNPSDAESHVVQALGAELLSILEDGNPGQEANIDAIHEWLVSEVNAGLDLAIPFALQGNEDPVEKWMELLKYGIDNEPVRDQLPTRSRNLEKCSTYVFAKDESSAVRSNLHFSVLLSTKTRYSASVPRLALGTILCQGTEDSPYYFLCLQPKCDSVRLREPTDFPLLPLLRRDGNLAGQKFSIVATLNGTSGLYFGYSPKPSELKMRTFSPGPYPPGEVEAVGICDNFYFQDTNGESYRWISELKEEHALKVVGEIGSAMSRPGPDDSEWLRLASRKGG